MPGQRRLPRSAPAEQGVPARAICDFLDSLDDGPELHSLMVLRHGHVIAEGWWHPYRRELPHELYSLSKSFTSTAVGFAVAEGRLGIDDLVLDHLGDLAPAAPDPRLARMRVRHLLTMTAGHVGWTDDRVFSTEEWARAFLALPLDAEPGTAFQYNTPATYVLSVILQRLTGERLLDYLRPRLLEPLGIEGATWEQSPEGVDTGGFGLSATTEDLACFGQLYLDDGVWQGRRVLPEGWVAEATRRHTDSHIDTVDWAQGYGYQFWRCQPTNVYRGDGAFGQFCVVMPDQDAVVVTTAGTQDLQGVLDRMWEHLAPALGGEGRHADAVDEPAAQAELSSRLDAPAIAPPAPVAAEGPGVLAARRVELDGAPAGVRAVTVGPEGLGAAPTTLEVEWAHGAVERVAVGAGAWAEGTLPPPPRPGVLSGVPEEGRVPVVAAAASAAPGEALVQVRPITTPFALDLAVRVDGDVVRIDPRVNVSFENPDLGEVTGRVVG